MYQLHDHSEAK